MKRIIKIKNKLTDYKVEIQYNFFNKKILSVIKKSNSQFVAMKFPYLKHVNFNTFFKICSCNTPPFLNFIIPTPTTLKIFFSWIIFCSNFG